MLFRYQKICMVLIFSVMFVPLVQAQRVPTEEEQAYADKVVPTFSYIKDLERKMELFSAQLNAQGLSDEDIAEEYNNKLAEGILTLADIMLQHELRYPPELFATYHEYVLDYIDAYMNFYNQIIEINDDVDYGALKSLYYDSSEEEQELHAAVQHLIDESKRICSKVDVWYLCGE